MTFGGGMTMQNGSALGALRPPGAEGAFALPKRGDAALHGGEVESLVHHPKRSEAPKSGRITATPRAKVNARRFA